MRRVARSAIVLPVVTYSTIPARLDRLPWSRWHWRIVHCARHRLGARRAGGDDRRLHRQRARAPRHARPRRSRGRLGGLALRRRRGARSALLRPPRRPPWAQAPVPADARRLHGRHDRHRVHRRLLDVRRVPLRDRHRHRRRVRGDQLGDRRADSGARAGPRQPGHQRQLLDRRRARRAALAWCCSTSACSARCWAGAPASSLAACSRWRSCWCADMCPRARAG